MRPATAGRLAEWVASVRPADVPASARHAARRVLLDQTGIGLADVDGLETPSCAVWHRDRAPARRATCWACGSTPHAPDAVLANRSRGDHLELLAGPECVAAAIAAAELADARLPALLDAIAVAASVEDSLRRWLQRGAEAHGLHPPALLGAATAAVAAGRLLGLDPRDLAGALATALSLAPQSPYAALSRGASGKVLYGAWAQMLGLLAALWAEQGIAGPPTVLEGSRGIAAALLDEPVIPPDVDPTVRAIEQVTFKRYPCNRACHAALTALEALGPPDPDAIARIVVETYPYAVELDRRASGDTPIAAQVSIRRTLALRLVFGPLVPRTYAADRVADPRAAALSNRISVAVHPRCVDETARVRLARLRVELRDGTVREAERQAAWGLEAPATDEELRARFTALTRGASRFDFWAHDGDDRVRAIVAGSAP